MSKNPWVFDTPGTITWGKPNGFEPFFSHRSYIFLGGLISLLGQLASPAHPPRRPCPATLPASALPLVRLPLPSSRFHPNFPSKPSPGSASRGPARPGFSQLYIRWRHILDDAGANFARNAGIKSIKTKPKLKSKSINPGPGIY